ncbi:MAG: hypothetical protein JWM86_1407 [Thermoleophilia bacterium]|nr:hypothetical protein [Thermoleophilia bacterium]
MSRWSLAIRILPLVALVVAAKAGLVAAGFEPIETSPLLASVVTANVFLLGFLLAGTLTDYKESERLPGEVASHLESIADECWILHTDKGVPAARECLDDVAAIGHETIGWFRGETAQGELLARVTRLDRRFLDFEPHTQANFISRLKSEQASIRSKLVRMHTIRVTGFVPAAYAIAEIGLGLLLVAMLASAIGPLVQACFFVGVISFFLGYMLLLIRDLDDPFEHAGGDGARGDGDEVSFAPVADAVSRIEARGRELDGARAARSVADAA